MEKLQQAICEILDGQMGYTRQKNGTYGYEIYAGYWDGMDDKTAIRILESKEPIRESKIFYWHC